MIFYLIIVFQALASSAVPLIKEKLQSILPEDLFLKLKHQMTECWFEKEKKIQNVHCAELGIWLCMCIFHLRPLWTLYNVPVPCAPICQLFNPSELQRLLLMVFFESIYVLVGLTSVVFSMCKPV